MEKMTNRKAINYVLENCTLPKEVEEKFKAMLAALDKKSTGERKPTQTQIQNEVWKNLIMNVMSNTGLTVTEIMKKIPEFADFSNQKVSALVNSLKDENKIVKTVEKGRSYFSLAK